MAASLPPSATGFILASAAATSVQQDYLQQARQMQALSFAAHIPLVCFAIAFPALVLFVEWLHLRSGDELYRALARRWSRVLAGLFAVCSGGPTASWSRIATFHANLLEFIKR